MGNIMEKMKNLDEIEKIADEERRKGRKIVFTNGCFDILHRGHIFLLFEAKKFGDILIVGINSDSSIKRIKGEKRPIIPLEDREYVLASISAVDYVVPFDEDTPIELIKRIKPNIIVKGEDWEEEKIVGRDFVLSYGGEVRRVKLWEGISTTKIIEKILELYKLKEY